MSIDKVDDRTYELATVKQCEYIDAVRKHGGNRKAAVALGVNESTIRRAIESAIKGAAKRGYSPSHDLTHETAPGNVIKRTSTNYDGDGNIRQQWVIQEPEKEKQLELMRAAVDELLEPIKPLPPIERDTTNLNKKLLNLYTLTDVHLGMLAWDKEGGDDWDMDIACRTVKGTFKDMLNRSPDCDECVVNQGGDWSHYDSFKPVTPAHGHVLDSDTRPQKMIKASIHLMRFLITEALKKHKKVNVIIQIGNHDEYSSYFLQQAMIALFENNPRVNVDDSPIPYYALRRGNVMLGFHHGHKRGNDQLPLLFAAAFAEFWGKSKYRDIHKAHRHHFELKEYSGATVIEHPTIASRDSHASHGGFLSNRAAICITYHKDTGRNGLTFSTPEMIRGK
jgi:hypothetical protein